MPSATIRLDAETSITVTMTGPAAEHLRSAVATVVREYFERDGCDLNLPYHRAQCEEIMERVEYSE